MSSTTVPTLYNLPPEILIMILSHLRFDDRLILGGVSRLFRTFIPQPTLQDLLNAEQDWWAVSQKLPTCRRRVRLRSDTEFGSGCGGPGTRYAARVCVLSARWRGMKVGLPNHRPIKAEYSRGGAPRTAKVTLNSLESKPIATAKLVGDSRHRVQRLNALAASETGSGFYNITSEGGMWAVTIIPTLLEQCAGWDEYPDRF